MGEVTAISWTDHTFNGWVGCAKVSPACDGCYAEAMMDKRYGRVKWGAPGQGAGTRQRTSAGNWSKPKAWDRKAAAAGTRPFVFCSSLADVFDNQVPTQWRVDLFRLIRATPNLVWLLLTKRPQLITRLYTEACREDCQWLGEAWPSNAAIGTTVEDQHRADINVPALLVAKKALNPAFTFLSCEPLLGAIDLRPWLRDLCPHCFDPDCVPSLRADSAEVFSKCGRFVMETPGPALDWVITGGETDQGGHKARPSHPDWYRSLRDQCAAAGVPYHHKQAGEWREPVAGEQYDTSKGRAGHPPAFLIATDGTVHCFQETAGEGAVPVVRVGKARSGRLLDGVEHSARPEVSHA